MKRFWLVLLSLGLVMAFSVSAFAVDVKVSGEYYIAGLYLDKVSLKDTPADNYSTAFLFQRLRIGTDFIVDDSLKLVTRVDIMERTWEPDTQANYATAINDKNVPSNNLGSGNGDARNVDWDIAYIDYVSPIGKFQVGYMEDYAWGTIWGNRTTGPTAGQIKYFVPIGPATMVFCYAKEEENSLSTQGGMLAEDRDYDSYRIGPIYTFKTDTVAGEAGLLFIFNDIRNQRGAAANPYRQEGYVFQPYFKTTIGSLFLQGELNYYTGKRDFETGPSQDIDSLSFWLDGDAKFGMFSVGGSLAYVQGDDDPNEINNALTGGRDWNPCLIMYNNNMFYTWVGAMPGYVENVNGEITNAIFGQIRASVTPLPKLTAGMSLSYARADEDFGGDSEKGFEVDLTGTYKITNNLSYMLGVGYLFTGDFYKGSTAGADVNNDYLVINKLTLNF